MLVSGSVILVWLNLQEVHRRIFVFFLGVVSAENSRLVHLKSSN